MKIPRDLSGRAVVKALCKHWDYRRVHQEGISSCRQMNHPPGIPASDHGVLRIGTLNSILRLVGTHKASTNRTCLPVLMSRYLPEPIRASGRSAPIVFRKIFETSEVQYY